MPDLTQNMPPGQHARRDFPRFGLSKFAQRFPAAPNQIKFSVGGDVATSLSLASLDDHVVRCSQVSDFHCVTTWSVLGLAWSGFRFRDFHEQFVVPHVRPDADAKLVVFRGEDGFAGILPLEDALASDVLLADQLNGKPLDIEHGAPLRLVAPAHYGYKNIKHIVAIEYWRDRRAYRFPWPYPQFMDHPRARVALEERACLFPSWITRYIYRLLVPSTVHRFASTLRRHRQILSRTHNNTPMQ